MARKKVNRKDKKCYREFVWLAESEYAHLSELLGKDATEKWIEDLNLYIGSKGDPYESHYYTIQVWARKAAKKTDGATGRGGDGAMKSEAQRAADRIIEALKDSANQRMPAFDEKTRAALFAVLTSRHTRWPEIYELRHDQTFLENLHADIVKAYSQK